MISSTNEMVSDNVLAKWLRNLNVIREIAEKDTMFIKETPESYFNVGRSGLRVCLTGLTARLGYVKGDSAVSRILDFGAGYGRVTRFLRVGFPDANIDVSDMDEAGPEWCEKKLSVNWVPSEKLTAKKEYDLIFLGSVFTHLRSEIVLRVIDNLKIALKPNGVLIFSAQGRYAYTNTTQIRTKAYRLTDGSIQLLLNEYESEGFAYQDYAPGRDYGISLISPEWMISKMRTRSDLVLASFQEKGFDNHQDTYTFINAPLMQKLKSGL